jgi:hypothetical protein
MMTPPPILALRPHTSPTGVEEEAVAVEEAAADDPVVADVEIQVADRRTLGSATRSPRSGARYALKRDMLLLNAGIA